MSAVEAAGAWPDPLFEPSRHGPSRLHLVRGDRYAEVLRLPVRRWHGPPGPEELAVLARAHGPVLDIGCGPGRHVAQLVGDGVVALGIDVSAAAVAAAHRLAAPATKASVFGEVPAAGCWRTALLLDGNIGIGGDPRLLLERVHRLLTPQGSLLVELDAPGIPAGRFEARVEHPNGLGPRFAWARVDPAAILEPAEQTGFALAEIWKDCNRWFAQLTRGT